MTLSLFIIVEQFWLTLLYRFASVQLSDFSLDFDTLDLFFSFFNHCVSVQVCLGSLSGCVTQFQCLAVKQTASHLTLGYFAMQRSSWSTQWLQDATSCCCKRSLNHHPSTTVLTVGIRFLCRYPVSGFCHCALPLDIFNLDSFVQKTLFHLVQSFSNLLTWILMFNVAKWTL